MKLSRCHQWAMLLLFVSLFDSFATLAALEVELAEEAGPVSGFLLKAGGRNLFLAGRTLFVLLLFLILELGRTRKRIPQSRCALYYRTTVIVYASVYIFFGLCINVLMPALT